MKKIMLGLSITLLLTACSGGGIMGGEDKFSATYVQSHIIKGKTTMPEVQAIYGVPDEQSKNSYGNTSWKYKKGEGLYTAMGLASLIPGASAVSSALGTAASASSASEQVSKASSAATGDSALKGNYLSVDFDEKNIVRNWHLAD